MEILDLAIVGALVSLAVQGIKKLAGTTGIGTLTIVAALSLLAGGGYYLMRDNTAFLEASAQILAFASAVYSFLIQRFEQ